MSQLLTSVYLMVLSRMEEFVAQERGDQITGNIVMILVTLCFGILLLKGIQTLFPVVWADVTTRITTIFTNP